MNNIRFFTILVISILSLPLLKAEGVENEGNMQITGVVLDERNMPLPGASIAVIGTTIATGTNTKGEFKLRLKEGSYLLRVSFMGYVTQELRLENNNSKLTFKLKPSENDLEEVVVTGTFSEKMLKDVPVLTRIITQKDIKRLNPTSIKSVLEYELPGIQFGRHHGSGLPTITFQGSSGEYVLFLLDGERISGEGAADNIDFEQFNIDEIERIEVIRGAASTAYGSNALGGVVNIITKNANRPVVANVSGRYSTRHEEKYSASGGAKKERLSFLSTLSYRNKDAFTVKNKNGSGSVDVNGYEIWQTSHKLSYVFNQKLQADLKGSFYNNRQSSSSTTTQNIYKDYALNARLHYLFNVNHRLNFSYNIDDYTKHSDQRRAGNGKSKTFDNLKNNFRLDYNWVMSDASILSLGSEVSLEKLKHYMFKDTTSYHVETYTLYAQEDWKMTNRFNVVAGVRADYHSEYNWHITPKLSLMYKLSNFTLRGGYAAGYRSPSLKELYEEWYHANGGGFYVYGNPDLKPETSHHLSTSAEYTKGIFNASVSAYYNRFKDKISNVSITDENGNSSSQFVNAEKAKTTGIDATMQCRFDWGLVIKGAYAYVNDHLEYKGKNSSSVRPHSVTFNADYNHKFGKVNTFIALNGRWMSSVKLWHETTVVDPSTLEFINQMTYTKYNSRTICSLNTGAQFPRGISLNMGLENVFNFKDKNVSSDTSISPEQGIGLVVSVAINIADLFKL